MAIDRRGFLRAAAGYGGGSATFGDLHAPRQVAAAVFDVRTYGAVGDGINDDRNAVQAAIDAAEVQGGGAVYFPAGTYSVQSRLEDVTAPVSLVGCGPASVVDATSANWRGNSVALINVKADGVTLRDLHIRTRSEIPVTNWGRSDFTIEGCLLWIEEGASNTNLIVVQDDEEGVPGNAKRIRILGNTLHHNSGGILCMGRDDPLFTLEQIWIRDNLVSSSQQVASAGDGIKVDRFCADAVVVGNQVVAEGGTMLRHGVNISEGTKRVIVSNNRVTGVTHSGIFLEGGQTNEGCTDVLLSDNLVVDSGEHGILVDGLGTRHRNVVIRGNLVVRPRAAGIREANETADPLIIEDNVVIDAGGVGLTIRSPGAIIRRNVVTGGAGRESIALRGDPSGVVIESNHFRQATAQGRVADLGLGSGQVLTSNRGLPSKRKGTALLRGDSTSVMVFHGLPVSPSVGDVSVVPLNPWGDTAQYWVAEAGPESFLISVDRAPGRELGFAWSVDVG